MALFTQLDEDAIYLSRKDGEHPLSSYSLYAFELDEQRWPSVEHYFQGMKFNDPERRARVADLASAAQAVRYGRSRLRKIRGDWSEVKQVIMTRAVYTKCKAHPAVAEALLDTGSAPLVENSLYDYYWGCGRDRRGNNAYGQVLMRVRDRLASE